MEDTPSEQRLRRQLAAFAQFTSRPMGEQNLDGLMMDACLRARAGVDVSHAKLLEYLPARDRLLLRVGVGWKDGYVGKYQVAPDLDTPIGYAFAFSEPVAIADYRDSSGYRYPNILKEHGCVASVNVPVRTDLGLFGILEIDHTSARDFSKDDIAFLMGLGNTIAQAIELHRALQAMGAALEEKQLLVREMNHRIKNNLSLVGAMLSLQARRFSDAAVRDEFSSAVLRINNLALVHDRLQLFTTSVMKIDAGEHFRELCDMLKSLLPRGITLSSRSSGSLPGDCVEPLTLIANELVTNSAKYAFADRDQGEIVVGYQEEGAGWRLWVQDDGIGMPMHDSRSTTAFGQQLIKAMASRVNAEVIYTSLGGTRADISCGTAAVRPA